MPGALPVWVQTGQSPVQVCLPLPEHSAWQQVLNWSSQRTSLK